MIGKNERGRGEVGVCSTIVTHHGNNCVGRQLIVVHGGEGNGGTIVATGGEIITIPRLVLVVGVTLFPRHGSSDLARVEQGSNTIDGGIDILDNSGACRSRASRNRQVGDVDAGDHGAVSSAVLVVSVGLRAETVALAGRVVDVHEVVVLINRIAHRADNLGQVSDHAVILAAVSVIVEGVAEVVADRAGDLINLVGLARLVGGGKSVGFRSGRAVNSGGNDLSIQSLARSHSVTLLHNAVLESDDVERVGLGLTRNAVHRQGALQSSIVSELDFAGNAVDIALNDPRTVGEGVSALLTVEVEQARDLGARGSADDVNVISNVVAVQVNPVDLSRIVVINVGEAGDGLEGIGVSSGASAGANQNVVLALTTRVLVLLV